MFRNLFAGLWLFGLGAGGAFTFSLAIPAPASAQVAPDPASATAAVERLHTGLIDSMKKGKALSFDGRVDFLKPIVAQVFDIESMARISTGGGWQKMSDADHAAVIKAFEDWTVADYASHFDEWDGEAFSTKKQEPEDAKGNVMVDTRLDAKGIPPVLFNYRLHKVDGAWKIFDIYLDAAISQLAMRRAEFASVLGRGGPTELIAHMNKLAADAKKGNG